MILKGKYWLASNEAMAQLEYSDFDVRANFTVRPFNDGVSYACTTIRISNYNSDWYVSYYASTGIFENGNYSIHVLDGNLTIETTYPYGIGSRIVDFGETPQTVELTASQEEIFNALFTQLADDEFVSEPNLVQVTNKIMDKLLAEAIAKIEKCKPTLTTVLNNTSGATSLSASINNYDLLFLRATTYTGTSYTPLCYVIPAKMMFSSDFGVGSSGNFLVQVADNSKYTNFKATASGLTRSAGSSSSYPGKIYQVYGLKFPTGVN